MSAPEDYQLGAYFCWWERIGGGKEIFIKNSISIRINFLNCIAESSIKGVLEIAAVSLKLAAKTTFITALYHPHTNIRLNNFLQFFYWNFGKHLFVCYKDSEILIVRYFNIDLFFFYNSLRRRSLNITENFDLGYTTRLNKNSESCIDIFTSIPDC